MAVWVLLVVPFVIVLLLNAYDGAMAAALPGIQRKPTIPGTIGSLLLVPGVVLHVVLMVRRGAAKHKS